MSLCCEGDKAKATSKTVTGTMNAEIPKDCTKKELEKIQKTLEESIANSLGKDPNDVKVIVNPETDEATYEIFVDDPTLAEYIQKKIKMHYFAKKVNKSIDENKKKLPKRIQDAIKIKDVTPSDTLDVNNYFF